MGAEERAVTYELVSALHIASATLALVCGFAVVALQKGNRRHKQFGYTYVVSMILLNVSALSIFRLTGQFGPFHYGALVSLLTVFAGVTPAYLRKPRLSWLHFHYQFMSWSFLGLLAAAFSEAAVRLPAAPFWPAVVVSSALIFIVGGLIINKRQAPILLAVRAQQGSPSAARRPAGSGPATGAS